MQNEGKNTVCKLCLTYCEYSFENVKTATKEMLRFLGLELDLNSNEKPIVCKTCSVNLQKCFDFKTVCIYIEDCISSFRDKANDVKLDLTDIYLRKNRNENLVSKCHILCRLCMNITESGCCIALDDEANDVISAKTILGTWFSELDLEITKYPVICTSCNESLHFSCSFMKSCLGIEDKIEKYCETEGSGNKLHVKSNSMLPFEAENASSCLNSNSNIEMPKNCKENDLHDENTLKLENLMQEGYQELYIKHEVDEHEEIDNVKVVKFSDIAENYREEKQNGETIMKCENLVGRESYGFNIKREEIDVKAEEGNTDGNQDKSLQRHMMIHKNALEVTTYSCGICTYKTTRKNYLTRHMLIHKNSSEVTMYSCEICTYKTRQKCHLTYHMLIHKNALEATTYSCEICTYKTRRKNCLKSHMLIHKNSSEVTMYSCEICAYKTKRKSNLKQHILIHKSALEAKTYSCGKCTYKTNQKSYLKQHMLIHGYSSEVTMYSCKICMYKAKREGCLERHMLIHQNVLDVTTYSCDVCTYKANLKSYLKRHMLIHRNSSEVTMYSCDICTYKTKRKSNLKQHMLIHKNAHEAATYSCGKCTFKTKQKKYLKRHTLIHCNSSEVTIYACDICAYKTKRNAHLKQHILIHKNSSEVTMYLCKLCAYKTKRKSDLRRHTLIHKNETKRPSEAAYVDPQQRV